jgi:hypothetical protein
MIANNITLKNVTDMINLTTREPAEALINMNWGIYGGWFFFVILWVLGFILYKIAQSKSDQPLINAMYVMTALTVLSFFLRAVQVVKGGIVYALITDWQMWIFPLLTALLAAIVKYMSDS